ncbi:AmmeMemoRadiSam system radical SAM enzyme [Oceanispirochaeta sp.]|jgi:pyruvate formate lyase activating enzyme|uniref:AmmeMemoRadiSam system radical SAM enzyme n=1 Tax=Oceanispirochaeta sp. TaxID=2035350 RepID=UPI00260751AD|nr:AmmeMemoRadiSam system radical SAM enzyme [Oceanispirochaeta sp.]MDA3955902.1 AmmeMemoRadiSam system radical SAM enzyme [Oceanispirochaeta sp.]
MSAPPLYRSLGDRGFQCLLCPHSCILKPGKQGLCGVRTASEDRIEPQSAPVTTMAVDPVEKKPFYHFLPGSSSLSIGFSGCNLKCPFCQNHELVSTSFTNQDITARFILEKVLESGFPSVSFTYSEPLVHIEFLIETAILLKENNIAPLLVTNGCINPEPGRWLISHMDAIKVDLKSFNSQWYKNELQGDLDSVKEFISMASSMVHLEVVTLIIPGKNDSESEIRESSEFLACLNRSIPFHLTAYYPQDQYSTPPTSPVLLNRLKLIASESLDHVYTGNTGQQDSTYCGTCGILLIDRNSGFIYLKPEGLCPECHTPLYGRF